MLKRWSPYKKEAACWRDKATELDTIYRQRQRQIALSQKQVDKMTAMRAEGYASNAQVEQQESELLDAKVRLQDVARQRIEIRQQHAQTRQQLREQPLTYFQQKNDLQQKLSDITQSMMENESRRSVDLRAPEQGTVSAVLVKPGQIVSAGQTIAMLLPDNAHLQARILLSSRAIGFIQSGQRVVLRYESFPWQNLGSTLARSVKSRHPPCHLRRSPASPAIQIQEPLYQVRSLDSHRCKPTANRLPCVPVARSMRFYRR
jgi:membrane fusion protein